MCVSASPDILEVHVKILMSVKTTNFVAKTRYVLTTMEATHVIVRAGIRSKVVFVSILTNVKAHAVEAVVARSFQPAETQLAVLYATVSTITV